MIFVKFPKKDRGDPTCTAIEKTLIRGGKFTRKCKIMYAVKLIRQKLVVSEANKPLGN